MEESISKVRENSNSCLRLPILHPWKRIAVLRCVSVFDSILWTRCLLQRLNVSSGFSAFKVILAFSGFNFLRLLFICFFGYNGKQFLFPCSSFQKKLQGDMRSRYDISSILQCFFFFCSSLFAQLHEPNYHTRAFFFIPIDRCSWQSTKTFNVKAKGTWWKKVWSKGPFVLEAVNWDISRLLRCTKYFPCFLLQICIFRDITLQFFLHFKDILSIVLDSFLWFPWQLYLSDNQLFVFMQKALLNYYGIHCSTIRGIKFQWQCRLDQFSKGKLCTKKS